MRKRIFVEPLWTLHGAQYQMLAYPPEGYELVATDKPHEKVVKGAARWAVAQSLLKTSDNIIPMALVKAWLQRYEKPPVGTALTYAVDHLVFRQEPWVAEVEYASTLAGVHYEQLRRHRSLVERALSSPLCRKIICWSEVGRKSLELDLDSRHFAHKIQLIPYAVPAKQFVKRYDDSRVKLLFVGSGVTAASFVGRGGEIFEVFAALCKRYSHLEMVVRSDVPDYIKARYGGMANLRIIDTPISREALDAEFRSADIFLQPSYGTVPFVLVEAMSYELPVVTIDSWANKEYVEHGVTGLVARRSSRVPDYYADTHHPNFLAPDFWDAVRQPDPAALADMAEKIAVLIEDPDLRRRYGGAGRWEVEHGRFSLAKMNEGLGKAFDEALADGTGPLASSPNR